MDRYTETEWKNYELIPALPTASHLSESDLKQLHKTNHVVR